MNEIPREKLREIIKRYGLTLVDDPRRVRALLLDHCGQYRREIFVLAQAQEEAVAEDLLEIPDSVPLTMLLSQLTHRLVENRALSPDAARWSVESWAYALGKPVQFSSDLVNNKDADGATLPSLIQPEVQGSSQSRITSQIKQEPSSSKFIPFNSDWPVDYYWRESEQADNTWDYLGQTPGKVLLPEKGKYKLVPHIAGDDLKTWVEEFSFVDRVVNLLLDRPVSDAGFSALQSFPNVVDLTVDNGESLSDEGFSHIQHLRAIKRLKLTWCTHLDDDGYTYLAPLKKVRDLKLEWAQITDNGCRIFERLPVLSHLGMRECKHIRGDGLQYIEKNTAITSLDLAGASSLVDTGMRYIGEMKQLTKLNLSHCSQLTDRGLINIHELRTLAHLSLGWIPALNNSTIDVLNNLSNLTSLSLSHTNITNAALAKINSVRNLAYLDLSGCDGITDRGLKNIKLLPNLTHLNLNGCKRLSSRGIDRLERRGLTILR